MRICVVSYHSSPLEQVGSGKSGGMSIVLRSLYGHLAREAEVDIYVRGEARVVEVGPRLRIIQVARFDPESFAEAIVTYDATQHYDLMHTHYWLSGIVGLKLRKVLKSPWIHSLHTVEILKTIRKDKARVEVEEQIIRACDLVVSPTRQEANAIMTLYPGARVWAVPHGVDTSQFKPSPNGHNNILFVGRIDPIKGMHLLIEAMRIMEQDVTLTVVGGGVKDTGRADDIRTYAAGVPVDFVGPVRHERLKEYYKNSALLVVPSYYESFGLVGLEAMASARPVVGFSHTGLQETVGDDAGILVKMGPRDLARAISRLMTDPALRQRIGRQGRKKSLMYDWRGIAGKYKRIYEKISQE